MSFFSPEIAVLHSAFGLVQKQFGSRKGLQLPSEKCGQPVDIIAHAVEEIVNGLEDDNTAKEQIQWNEKLHDLILYKVCQSHDKSQPIIDENSVLGKTEMLAQILPDIDVILYTEVVKRCGWTSICLSRLECIEADIGKNVFKEILHCLVTSSQHTDANISFLFDILDFVLSSLLTKSTADSFLTISSSQENFLSVLLETVLEGLANCDIELFFKNLSDGNGKNKNLQIVPKDIENQHLIHLYLLGVLAAWSGEQNKDRLQKWLYLNIRGHEIEFLDNANCFYSDVFFKEHGLGKYCKFPQVVSKLDLNLDRIESLKQSFPWNSWQSVAGKFQSLESIESSLPSSIPLSVCPLHVQMAKTAEKAKPVIKTILLECSYSMFQDTEKMCSEIYQYLKVGQVQSNISIDSVVADNFDLDTVIWRIDSRQPGYRDCIALLLSNKLLYGASVWKSTRLKEVLLSNIDLLVDDITMMRMYNLYIELEECLVEQELLAVRHLITSAFVKLSPEVMNKHVCSVYKKYKYWPKEERVTRSGEVTAVFNKLTSSTSRTGIEEVYKQLLQDPELVLENLVDRAISSKNQVDMYTEILKSVPDICKACHHGNSHMSLLISTVTSYLSSKQLSYKEHRNVLMFVSAVCSVEESKSLLNPAQLLSHVVVPNLNIEHLYATSQPITTNFSSTCY